MFELPVAETFLGIQRGFRVKDVASIQLRGWELLGSAVLVIHLWRKKVICKQLFGCILTLLPTGFYLV